MLLKGTELAGYIKQRQYETVRGLQHLKIKPRLAVIQINKEVISSKYIRLKQRYGRDIGVDVAVHHTDDTGLFAVIERLNDDDKAHGLIVQLPLPSSIDREEVLNMVAPEKDIDGLGSKSQFDPATPTAILWLLGGYDIDLKNKNIIVVGQGRLVGKPLTEMLRRSGVEPVTCDIETKDIKAKTKQADVIITATGKAGLITNDLIKPGAVVIDAGTADINNKLAGDVDPALYEREDIKVSPVPGGVGPLTVCVLFEHLIQAATAALKN